MSSSESNSISSLGKRQLPALPVNLREKKVKLAIFWVITFIANGVLPIAIWLGLSLGTNMKHKHILAILTATFGIINVYALSKRSYRLTKQGGKNRPEGATKLQMDFFHWNYVVGFIYVTMIVVVGVNVHVETIAVRLVSLPLGILVFQVCIQLLYCAFLVKSGRPYPFRFSSVPAGAPARPAVFTMTEDVCAVDGDLGKEYRSALIARYDASPEIRTLMYNLDLVWGVSGIILSIVVVVLVAAVPNIDAALVIGWALPWVWAAVCTKITFNMTSRALNLEAARTGTASQSTASINEKSQTVNINRVV